MQTGRHHGASCPASARFLALCFLTPGLLGLCLPAWAPPARAQGCDAALLSRAQAAYQQMGGFEAGFKQEDREPSGRVSGAGGRIAYRKPGQMRWDYAAPNPQQVITDGATVWLYDPLLENVTVQPLGALAEGTPLKFLLGAGNLAADFTCRAPTLAAPGDGLTYLELVPKTRIPTLAFIQLGVRRGDAGLEAFRMVDSQGAQRTVRLLDLKPRTAFPAGHFTFKIAPGMEVITK
jgi:outer membrane lipoprotein carrier protein